MKVGDRVRLTSGRFRHCRFNPTWPYEDVIGTISRIINVGISVEWDNGKFNVYDEDDLTAEEIILNVNELFEDIEL